MRHITNLNEAPDSFDNWVQDNSIDITRMLADESVTGGDLWGYFRESQSIYNELKKVLVENQGFLCCYCGQRIKNDHHTLIEHLLPKSLFKNQTLSFDNLFASCKGGSKNIIHPIGNNESLVEIAENFGVDIGHIEEVYVQVDEEKLFRTRYDIENLSEGDKLVIYPQLESPEQHCDTKKKSSGIEIIPSQEDSQNKFLYDLQTGKIIITEENTSA